MNKEMLTIRLNSICYAMGQIEQEIFNEIYDSGNQDWNEQYIFGDHYFIAWHDIYDLFEIPEYERIIDE